MRDCSCWDADERTKLVRERASALAQHPAATTLCLDMQVRIHMFAGIVESSRGLPAIDENLARKKFEETLALAQSIERSIAGGVN